MSSSYRVAFLFWLLAFSLGGGTISYQGSSYQGSVVGSAWVAGTTIALTAFITTLLSSPPVYMHIVKEM